MPIALLLPLVPVLVEAVMKIIDGIKGSGKLTPEQHAVLDRLAQRLDETALEVQALDIRDV